MTPATAHISAEPGEEMAALIARKDWSQTAIGAPETWSTALRTMVRILVMNRFPLLLWWGPDYVSIYNDAYRPILGRKHPDALGLPVRECWHEIWHVLKPLIDTPFQGGPATWSEDLELEIGRSGFTEETHFTVAYSPVPDETAPGGIGGVLATVHEITEKVIAGRRSLILRDLGPRTANAKTAEGACAGAAEVLGAHIKDVPFALLYLADPESEEAHLAACSGELDGTATTSDAWPLRAVSNSGQMQAVGNRAVVLPIRSNVAHQLAGFLVAGLSPRLRLDAGYRDFLELAASQIATGIANARAYEEERKRAEALAEIDRAKIQFFSNVSHEFRTPLTLLLGPLEDMLAQSGWAPADRERLEVAHRNALRLLKLVNTLLDFSRIEAGRIQASYEPTDLAALTTDLASMFRAAIERAGIKFRVDCPSLSESVYADREMWEKIVLNLLSNAFKFTFEGEIEVLLRETDGAAELAVRDTGTGIPAADLPRIFERFYRAKDTSGRTFEGSGIGLALVQDLVKLHGGTVSAESEAGRGSRFIVSIPFGKAHLPAEHIRAPRTSEPVAPGTAAFIEEALRWLPETPPRAAAASRSRSRILLADDNADMREYLTGLLGDAYRVSAVTDGAAALKAARECPPDLVLADIMMPGLDGLGLLREMRADQQLQAIPVILLSARAGEEARVEGMEAGADDYLVKPFLARELLARVGARLDVTRMRRDSEKALRRVNLTLRRANADLEQFAYSASHDLQEPIRNISIYSELLNRRYGQVLDAKAQEYLSFVTAGAQRMEMLVSDLLAYLRTANMESEPVGEIDAARVLESAIANLSSAIDESQAEISHTVLPRVRLRAVQLEQLFQNLIGNAIKYRRDDEPPRIRITAERKNGDWLFAVRDNGIGINAEYQKQVFGIFKRLHNDGKYAGTGIGLAICQKIVERNGGTIWVESEGSGKGSTFYFTLPGGA